MRYLLVFVLLGLAAPALAQDGDRASDAQEPARIEARRLLEEALAHDDANRPALAAQSYLAMYQVMRGAALPRAPIALYSAGRALARVPGRETEALDALQRFLTESTPLTDDAEVRDWRSNALEQIAELQAREPAQPPEVGPSPSPTSNEGSISPVGPILIGVGGASLLAGAVLLGMTVAENDALVAICSGGICPSSARAQADGVQSMGLAADITIIGGAIVAATGLVLTLLVRDGGSRELPVAVGCSPNGCNLDLRGSF